MNWQGLILGRTESRRAALLRRVSAAVMCLALLYFAGGGRFLHQHNGGPDTTCHVCQALHAPALTTSFSGVACAPQISGWHDSRPVLAAVAEEFSLHRAGRAPPTA